MLHRLLQYNKTNDYFNNLKAPNIHITGGHFNISLIW